MQSRSDLWKELAASGTARLETVADINGVTYASISSPVISRALMADALSVGNCTSATLQMSVLTENSIPASAEVTVRKRLSDGMRYSEWLPAGTFYVSQRQIDQVTGRLFTLTCYDAMRRANAAYALYEGDEGNWPKSMTMVIYEIAQHIGVSVDSRTWTHIRDGPDYVVPRPEGLTMQKVLGYIAGIHGGNWHMTQENQLRFVPVLSGSDALSAADRLDIFAITGAISTGPSTTIAGVFVSNGQETFTAGSQGGYVLTVPRNPYATQTTADDLFARMGGLVYSPYTIEKGLYDPAAELGDYVVSRDDVQSVLYAETARMNLAFRGDLSAPFKAEIADEYPYRSKTDELDDELRELVTVVADKASIDDLYAIRAQIDNLSVSDIKTGMIHSSDYLYGPYPRVYPTGGLYPSGAVFPSNGEIVLKGFAIDFSSGVIYGAFYSEQILALQEITTAHAARLEALGGQLGELETALTAVQQKDQTQDGQISALQATASEHSATINEHTNAISALQGTVATQGGNISTNQTAISNLQSDVSDLSDTANAHGTDIATLKNSASAMSGRLDNVESKDEAQDTAITALQGTVASHDSDLKQYGTDIATLKSDITTLRAEIQNAKTDWTAAVNALKNALTYPKAPPQS